MNGLAFKKNSKNQKLLQSLSGTHVSKSGYEFDFESDTWPLDGSVRAYLKDSACADEDCQLGFRATLSRYAEEYSASHTYNMTNHFMLYLKNTKETRLTLKGVSLFKQSLGEDEVWRLGAVKGFWLSWIEWGFPGVDSDVEEFLDELTLAGNKKGQAVLKMCPYTGPFTELEQSALLEWSANAFQDGELALDVYTYFIALMFTGRRDVQIRALRACDLSSTDTKAGTVYELRVPRAKQRGEGFRGSFRSVEITEDFYLLLRSQINESIDRIEERFDVTAPDALRRELPVFVSWGRLRKLSDIFSVESRLSGKTPDYLHAGVSATTAFLKDFAQKCQAKSERTGDFITLNSRRFRYTKGTNLTRRGISGATLAAALDHQDKQHVGVYAANTPEHADMIDEVMADALAPLAQAFAGTLIDSERDALRANDPHSRVKNAQSKAVGSCGTHNFCANGYRACYTCVKFQPWRDAPHHEVLEEILEERAAQKAVGVSGHVIQATDRLVLAVKQVIQLCKEVSDV
jgi:hypothetical protein